MAIESGRRCYLCDGMVVARDLCATHYKRWQRYGDPEKDNTPEDWGQRRKHLLYDSWRATARVKAGRCESWDDFWKFVDDIGERPTPTHIIQRKDSKKPFSLENCYWKERLISGSTGAEDGRKSRKRAKGVNKHQSLKKQFGIGLPEYQEMLEAQNGVCAICENHETRRNPDGSYRLLAVDHCHESQKIRGLLCTGCNTGIGLFRDNPEYLAKAIEYLKSHNK